MYCMSPWCRTTMRDIGNGRNEDCDRYMRRNGGICQTNHRGAEEARLAHNQKDG